MNNIWWIVLVFVILVVIYLAISKTSMRSSIGALFGGSESLIDGGGKFGLYVQEPWFAEIAAGRKTVEARMGGGDKFQDLIGKKIAILGGPGKKIATVVTAVRHYADLDAYLKGEGWKVVAPHAGSEKAAKEAYLTLKNKAGDLIFAPASVKEKGGIVAIEFEKVSVKGKGENDGFYSY